VFWRVQVWEVLGTMTYRERVRFVAFRKRVPGARRSSFWWRWLLIINKQLRLAGKREGGL